jgi:carbamoyltransferase
MRILGVSALSHDASLAVVEDDAIRFAAHAERYSRVKNDPYLSPDIIQEAVSYGRPDVIAWYERPLVKKARHLIAGQYGHAAAIADLPRGYLRRAGLGGIPIRFVDHHHAHAAAGAATSGFVDCSVLVADAIGEFTTFSAFAYEAGCFRKARSIRYPHSLGLLYSAFTRRCGFKPNEEEYILMAMAGYGTPVYAEAILRDFVELREFGFRLRRNVHRGIGDWRPDARLVDLAASIQQVTEEILLASAAWLRRTCPSANLILAGGLALNCVANSKIAQAHLFDRIWIMPNPGDAGSSLGAAAAVHGSPLNWPGPYLGTRIERPLSVRTIVESLEAGRIVGVANGAAEFGPRALGNRSLLADPRGPAVKDQVNQVKGREPFRPFAPAILHEMAGDYFDMAPGESPYMQYVMTCRKPMEFPGIVHCDGTSRVQTVRRDQNANLYDLLREFHRRTGCPMLLNTSLNLKGEPLVNTLADAQRFSRATGVEVF